MIRFLHSVLLALAQKKHSVAYYTFNFIITILFIFVIVPYFYIYTGQYLTYNMPFQISIFPIFVVAVVMFFFGGTLMIWALVMHYNYGKGAASHTAPIQCLLISGPYALSRHPMLLGAVFFYFGIGTIVSSVLVGLYGSVITAILAYVLIVYIEEPVLLARFGQEYKEYQKKVPVIPFLFNCFYNCNRKHKSHN